MPDGVTSVSVDAYGAKGGSISNYSGGRGGQVTTNLTVTPGETLYIRVGQYVGQKYSQIFAFGGGRAGHLTLKSDRQVVVLHIFLDVKGHLTLMVMVMTTY